MSEAVAPALGPVLSLFQPSAPYVNALLEERSVCPFTYDDVGGTGGDLPPGWAHDEKVIAGTGRGGLGGGV